MRSKTDGSDDISVSDDGSGGDAGGNDRWCLRGDGCGWGLGDEGGLGG